MIAHKNVIKTKTIILLCLYITIGFTLQTLGPIVEAGPDDVVVFPDANLEAAIREALSKPEGHITVADMKTITSLIAPSKGITDITGLDKATNLKVLYLPSNNIEELTPLSDLIYLNEIWLFMSEVTDISPLANLTNLELLNITNNRNLPITGLSTLAKLVKLHFLDLGDIDSGDISVLANFVHLRELWISGSNIVDIHAVSKLVNLERLGIAGGQVVDISPLSNLVNLTDLYLTSNQITDISSLVNLNKLETLYLPDNNISDITVLSNMKNLGVLNLASNQISDISNLANLTRLGRLDLQRNEISNITALVKLTSLDSIDLLNNQITDISALANLKRLKFLSVQGNLISDISALSHLTNLERLELGFNQITDITALSSLTSLKWLTLDYNRISNISALANMSNLELLSLYGNYINIAPGSPSRNIIDAHISNGVNVLFEHQKSSSDPTDANLSALTVNTGTLTPTFSTNTTAYTVNVSQSISSINVTAALANSYASMRINGTATSSGAARSVSLNAAGTATVINIAVTAKDGVTKKTYQLTVNRGTNNDSDRETDLESLIIKANVTGTIKPVAAINYYTVAHYVNTVNISANLFDINATMTINGEAETSGKEKELSLNDAGGKATEVNITVTSSESEKQKVYKLIISRMTIPDNNADLKSLMVNPGYVIQKFSANRTKYDVVVPLEVNEILVHAVTYDPNAKIYDALLTSTLHNIVTYILPLNDVGSTTVKNITVFSANEKVNKAYILTVYRMPKTDQPVLLAPWVGSEKMTQGNNSPPKPLGWKAPEWYVTKEGKLKGWPWSHRDQGAHDPSYAIDIGMGMNTPVLSMTKGTVYRVYGLYKSDGKTKRPEGRQIIILSEGRTGKIYCVSYKHLDYIPFPITKKDKDGNWNNGQEIDVGDIIALSGNTGHGTGAHLHFSIWEFNPNNENEKSLPMERLLLKGPYDDKFRFYNALNGDLDTCIDNSLYILNKGVPDSNRKVYHKTFISNNVANNVFKIALGSPASMRIYDAAGRVTGIVNGEVVAQIPGSSYHEATKSFSVSPPLDNYSLEVIGTKEGVYSLSFFYYDESGPILFDVKDINTSTGEIHKYEADWSKIAHGDGSISFITEQSTRVHYVPNRPSNPSPSNLEYVTGQNVVLSWSGGANTNSNDDIYYKLFFGSNLDEEFDLLDTIGPFPASQVEFTYPISNIEVDTYYNWQVVASNSFGLTTEGPVWSFTTEDPIFTPIEGISSPRYIYYENVSGELVMVDYQKAVDDLLSSISNRYVINAIREKLGEAFIAGRLIYVEDSNGRTLDYLKASQDGHLFKDVYLLSEYWTEQQTATKELVIDIATGKPLEMPIVR
jgi:internalin A